MAAKTNKTKAEVVAFLRRKAANFTKNSQYAAAFLGTMFTIVKKETGFNATADSGTGCTGLGQFSGESWRDAKKAVSPAKRPDWDQYDKMKDAPIPYQMAAILWRHQRTLQRAIRNGSSTFDMALTILVHHARPATVRNNAVNGIITKPIMDTKVLPYWKNASLVAPGRNHGLEPFSREERAWVLKYFGTAKGKSPWVKPAYTYWLLDNCARHAETALANGAELFG